MTGNLKSQDEFYLGLHEQLVRCDPLETTSLGNRFLQNDLKTLRSRCHYEGVAFLTKTLPVLGKALDRGLVTGRFNIPLGFKRSHRSASIPAFMQAYFNLIFNEDGLILDTASVGAIRHLRQVLYFAYKLEMPYSVTEKEAVLAKFAETDEALELGDSPLARDIISLAKIITRKVFHDFDHRDIRPQHGPGAVATGEKLEDKWVFHRLYNAIHQVYPYYDYFVSGGVRELTDRLDWYKSLVRLESGTSKVILVPKDSRGPRLISCEPLEYQWIQQGLGRKLQSFLELDNIHTRGHVNFTNQEINGNIAKTSSASQHFATLDLKDASDRVSLELVRRVFIDSPQLLRALEACRSTATKLPNGRVLTLRKFASMGSALCFPVEAYLFWVIIVAAVVRETRLPLERVEKLVYVYGDDIVVPTKWAMLSIQALESVDLMVNVDKSCITGYFRESCGVDAYKGEVVTPLRLHTPWTNQSTDGSALVAYVSLANQMASRGYLASSDFIWEKLELTYGKIPYGTAIAPYPCRIITDPRAADYKNMRQHRWRVNRSYQRLEFLLPSLSPRRIRSKLDGWLRLTRNFVAPPFADPSVAVVPRSARIKRGWMRVA